MFPASRTAMIFMQMKKIDNLPESFCLSPWTHTYISPQGERRMCCASREPAQNFKQYIDTDAGTGEFTPLTLEQHWNSEHMRDVRRRMLAGETLPECEVCNDKLLNTDVYRSYFNNLFKYLIPQAIETTDETGYTSMSPISWDYRYSNICNFKCRMCGDMLSSAWESEVVNNNMVNYDNPKNNWLKLDNRTAIKQFVSDTVVPEFMDAVEAKTIREIYWVGGEPLLYPQHWQAVSRIVELEYANLVRLRYNTNLSQITYKGWNLYELLGNYNNWEICASLDGTGPVGQYIRTGLNYNNWLENFKMGINSQKHHRQMRIDFTLTLPGMVEVARVVHLANELGVNLLSKVVFAFTSDIVLSPLCLPKHILLPWIETIQEQIKPHINNNTKSMWDVLEQLKNRPTFEEQWGVEQAAKGRATGKAHVLRLENIRKDKLTLDDILAEYKPAQTWWRNI